jgi:hypothetical protein
MTIVRIRHGEGRYTGIIMVEVKRGARGGIWWSRVATFPTVERPANGPKTKTSSSRIEATSARPDSNAIHATLNSVKQNDCGTLAPDSRF